MNTDASWPNLDEARARVLGIQAKLHRWAGEDVARRFDDLFNLVADPAFLTVAWERVSGNTGARTAGVDGIKPGWIAAVGVAEAFLADVREQLRSRTFVPVMVREVMIPKPGTSKRRRLGIPTVADRVVQAALKLVLEPIFEADFKPCSYGFRPNRRAHDAIAEIQFYTTRGYEWVLEADIEACFDSIDHTALMDRVRQRVGDKRVLTLIKAFLKAGILTELGHREESITGTPQGGILSPLLANIALSALDEHFVGQWQQMMGTSGRRVLRGRKGLGNWRLVRYADDFVVMVYGNQAVAEALREQVAALIAPLGLRLAEAKTRVVHIDEGFDFLGHRIQRHRKRGTSRQYVYTMPSRKAIASIKAKVRALTNRSRGYDLAELLRRVNAALRGWANYFRHGVSKRFFSKVDAFTWWRIVRWIRKRRNGLGWKATRRRFMQGWKIVADGITFTGASPVAIVRYRYRGEKIPTPWTASATVS
ncbi:group II intron reverse transcriptase/maturase [Plantactinospora sp. WMMB334]|uniref:group II intron reverse transcriptase/maturase n=1 Tax=Plantactinospora sp. WMMB334 TaxID=3404119 RepID=UPI003B93DDD9